MGITHQFHKIWIFLAKYRFISILKKLTVAVVSAVKAVRNNPDCQLLDHKRVDKLNFEIYRNGTSPPLYLGFLSL